MQDEAWQSYLYPGSRVLKNLAGLEDNAALLQFERGATAVRAAELRINPVESEFGLAHQQAIHKQLFKDVYSWAGEIRTVDLTKGVGVDRTLFSFVEDIHRDSAKLERFIAEKNRGRGLEKSEASQFLADVYSLNNSIHPFREGNGRTTREFIQQLAKESGLQLDYQKVGREEWNRAAIDSAHQKPEAVRKVFYEIVQVERAVAFDRLPAREALARHPELDGALKSLGHAKNAGLDVDRIRAHFSNELHAGRIVRSDVSIEDSKGVIAHAAAHRGLQVRDGAELGGSFEGKVVAVSSAHVLLRVGDLVAVRYEKTNLSRPLYEGERAFIQFDRELSVVENPKGKAFQQIEKPQMDLSRERSMQR